MEWSGRAPALPVREAGKGRPRQGARHVSETRRFARRNRHRYRQKLVPHRWPESARCHRAAAEMVARPGAGPTRQSAAVSNWHGGLRRRASPQSQAANAWPRRPLDAGGYVRPYSKGQKNDFRDAEAIAEAVQRPTMSSSQPRSPTSSTCMRPERAQRCKARRTRNMAEGGNVCRGSWSCSKPRVTPACDSGGVGMRRSPG